MRDAVGVAVGLGTVALLVCCAALMIAIEALRQARRFAPTWMRRKLVTALRDAAEATDLLRRVTVADHYQPGPPLLNQALSGQIDRFLTRRCETAADDEVTSAAIAADLTGQADQA